MTALVELGWTDFFARNLVAGTEHVPARVIAEHRSGYQVQTADLVCAARISGRLRHTTSRQAELPAVGDWVLAETDGGEATIHHVLPRKSRFSRKVAGKRTEEQIVAANVDNVWIVCALDNDFNLRRIERYLTVAWESGAAPVIVLTKSDLSDAAEQCTDEVESMAIGTPVHTTSSLTRDGLSALQVYFRNHATVALMGSSGVGKSTLINALAGSTLQATSEVRGDGKGRHTTTHRELICLPTGGLIIDTPGMRELQLWECQTDLGVTFGDVNELASGCRFTDCRHIDEPGCAVLDAVAQGHLEENRLQSYQKLQRELAYPERKQDARAGLEEKKRIKSQMKSMKKHHPKYNR